MANQAQFGRRGAVPPQPARALPATAAAAPGPAGPPQRCPEPALASPGSPRQTPDYSPLDDESQQWKQARRQSFAIPWRQLSLMATLCFGIASLVLPDSVNDTVQWLLYALGAMSLYVGIFGRRPLKI